MKLNAPPPSEPEPGPESVLAAEAGSAGTPAISAAPSPAPEGPPKPAGWPQWFASADLLLAALAVAIAFLSASFAAHNSDLWLHLASGQRLVNGGYSFGADPFSYTALDRTWVNHSWLYDLVSFLLFAGDGFLLVLVKALAVAATFALILAIRQPSQPFWPWAMLAATAALASAGYFSLRPLVASAFFFALTLFLVFRLPSRPGSWRLPIALGITFALWSNSDEWFFVGPAAIALLTIGEAIRRKMGPVEAEQEIATLGPLPDLQTLTRALAVGAVACMVNPHHFRVWQLPFELVGMPGAEADPRLRIMLFSPIHGDFWKFSGLGNNLNGLAYVLLILGGIYAAFLSSAMGRLFGSGVEVEPLPLPHLFFWCGAATLSLLSMYAIPLFAIATVPLVASRLNALSARVALGPRTEFRTRILLSGSVGGRLISVLALVGLAVAAWPGWLHPSASSWWDSTPNNPASARRVDWAIRPDPELKNAAEWLQDARASGRLPADLHGILTSIDQANYCAWFAPNEKVFANSQFLHHGAEWADFIKLRQAMGLLAGKSEVADVREARNLVERWNAGYIGVAANPGDKRNTNRVKIAMVMMMREWPSWSIWYFNGRCGISGWRMNPDLKPAILDRLEVDPARLAFGPDVKLLPAITIAPPRPMKNAWDEFLRGSKPIPAGAEEAIAWGNYKDITSGSIQAKETLLRIQMARLVPRVLPWPVPEDYIGVGAEKNFKTPDPTKSPVSAPWPKEGALEASTFLAFRAAHQAIANNPDHPDGYYALAKVLEDTGFPMSSGQRRVALVSAYQRCLARMPEPARYRPSYFLTDPSAVCVRLTEILLGKDTVLGQRFPSGEYPGMRIESPFADLCFAGALFYVPANPAIGGKPAILNLPPIQQVLKAYPGARRIDDGYYLLPLDLARQTILKAEEYARIQYTDLEIAPKFFKLLEEQKKPIIKAWEKARKQFRGQAERMPDVRRREALAVRAGLIGDALDILRDADFSKDFGDAVTEIVLHQIALLMVVGRLEDAAMVINEVRDALNKRTEQGAANSGRFQYQRRRLAELEYQRLLFEGNFKDAGQQYEQLYGQDVGKFPPMADLAHTDMKGFDPAHLDERPYQFFGVPGYPGVGWAAFSFFAAHHSPLDLIARMSGSYAQIERYKLLGEVYTRMRSDSDFFFTSGLLALFAGDIKGARQRFESTTRQPPPGWKTPPVRNHKAAVFLGYLDYAAKAQR